jgi:hypothetical protein
MIVIPPGWSVTNELESIELVHPGGRDVAVIEYRERVRPLAKAGAIVRRLVAERAFRCGELPDVVERLTTVEGEYASQVTLAGDHGGRPAQCDLGIVFGDDFYARIAAICYRNELYEELTRLVHDLVVGDVHALGLRRRRFEYAPPRGWQPIVREFVTDWLAPDYPSDAVLLTVFPANPLALAPAKLLAMLLGANRPDARVDRQTIAPLHTSAGLAGELGEAVVVVGERRLVKLCAVLHDTRFVYALEATAGTGGQLATHRSELERVIDSVQPLPNPFDQPREHDYAAQSYWIE